MNSLLEDVKKEPGKYQTSERIEGLLNVISEVRTYYYNCINGFSGALSKYIVHLSSLGTYLLIAQL